MKAVYCTDAQYDLDFPIADDILQQHAAVNPNCDELLENAPPNDNVTSDQIKVGSNLCNCSQTMNGLKSQ